MTRVIGLSGYAQSGKDSVANVLIAEGYERIAFADPLKALALQLDPPILVSVDGVLELHTLSSFVRVGGWEKAKKTPAVRQFLIDLGAGAREHIHPEVWIDAADRKMKPMRCYVFTDVRYKNEAELIKMAGGEIWRIYRNGVGPANGAETEAEVDEITPDRVINNFWSIEDLEILVREMLGKA